MSHWNNTMLAFSFTLLIAGPSQAAIDFSHFHGPSEVDTILNDFVTAHPSLARVSTIGTSYEGRPIKVLKISDNVAANEPAEGDVLFVALHHAREWISVEMTLYLAEQILTQYATNSRLQEDVNNLQVWIVPVVNPDGFAYTQLPCLSPCIPGTSADPRYWRKNRRNNGDGTFGVDLNRNWGHSWGLSSGSSGMTSLDTYRGTAPFSETETAALRIFANGLNNLKTMVTYHSFGELFLRPWGYTTADAPGEETLRQLALRSINVIQAIHGHTYSEDISYTASGETTDWFWGEHRISAFTPELRPASGLLDGFAPPPGEIVPSNEENLPGALSLLHDAGARELWIKDYVADTGAEPSAVWTGTNWSQAFWVSPDISTVPVALVEGTTVDLKVLVRNNTGASQSNVRLDIYYTDPRISLEFPNPNATLIASRTLLTIPAAGATVTVPWTVPIGANSWGERHWCVGAIVMQANDLPLTTEAQRSSNIAIRNFNTTEVLAGANLLVAATNYLEVDAELKVFVDALPPGWRVVVPARPQPGRKERLTSIERKGLLLDANGFLLRPGETMYLPVRVIPAVGAKKGDAIDVNVHGGLLPLVANKRTAAGNGFTYRVVAP